MAAPAFKYIQDGSYSIIVDSAVIGRVWRRRGGWWTAVLDTGASSGSWCGSRREAVGLALAAQAGTKPALEDPHGESEQGG